MKFKQLVWTMLLGILTLIVLAGLGAVFARPASANAAGGRLDASGLSGLSGASADAPACPTCVIIPPDPTATPVPGSGFYVSSRTAGTIGGVATTPQDILLHNPGSNTYEMAIDGSDVGMTKPISAFTVNADGNLLVTFKANVIIPGVGTFTPWDIALFTPTSIGNNTAGTFSWYFDGSDVGLTTTAEKIDALDIEPDGKLYISTVASLSVPKPGGGTLTAQDEDLMRFAPTAFGATTAGAWSLYFDGTAVPGLGIEDIASVNVIVPTGDIYVALLDNFNIGGLTGTGKDIVLLHPIGGGAYSASLFWRGPDHGFKFLLSGIH